MLRDSLLPLPPQCLEHPGMNDSGCLHARLVRTRIRAVIDGAGCAFSREEQSLRTFSVLAGADGPAQCLMFVPVNGLRHGVGAERGFIEAPACYMDRVALNGIHHLLLAVHSGKS